MLQCRNWPSIVCLLAVLNGLFFLQKGHAQEEVVPLQYNPVLHAHEADEPAVMHKKKKAADTLTMPFFDDFSYEGPYPDDRLWLDNNVFVNSHIAIKPPSYGVATFDGLNEHGNPYNPNRNNNNVGLPTDTLTSTYIDLSGSNASDDIYLSFFYQPKGLGDEPEHVDSLLVQIKNSKDSNQWQTIWRIGGGKDYDPVPDFEPVMLPVDYPDSAGFYHEGFQFRFLSYGNVSGNLDNWHVDYIELGERSPGDTTRRDVAIVEPPLGLLEEYREVPWSQFDESYLKDSVFITARNMGRQRFNVHFGYSIVDLVENETVAESFSQNFTYNINSHYGVHTDNQENLFDRLDFPGRDSVHLMLNAAVTEGDGRNDETRANDTFQKTLFFQHYFAYDDATAEGGYGLEGFYETGKVAQRFSLNNRDSLRAVGIKFNQSKEDVSNRTFDLKVWSNLGPLNEPDDHEEVLTTEEGLKPRYNGRGHDNFVIYELEEPVALGGVFYIGWEQYQEYNLNVGLDKGYSRHSGQNGENKIFYNDDGSWRQSSVPKTEGAVMMIRPYVGGDSINYYNQVPEQPEKRPEPEFKVAVYPNPVQNRLTVAPERQSASNARLDVKVYNLSGKKLIQAHMPSQGGQLDMSGLTPGMYLLKVRDPGTGTVVHKKVIKE